MFHLRRWHGLCSVTKYLASPRPPATPRISPGVGGRAAGDTFAGENRLFPVGHCAPSERELFAFSLGFGA